jgi:hypothetical protein
MSLRRIITFLALAGVAGAAVVATSSSVFQGAPAGIPVHFQPVALPDVAFAPGERPHPGPGAISPFEPSLDQLLNGNTVVKNEAQMKQIWGRLFAGPYDASLFDFDHSFVVMMGGGFTSIASFGIGSVEIVNGTYPQFGFGSGGGVDSDPFLSVTSTMFFPGVMPQNPPPGHYVLSAVKVSKDLLDDVVFHRMYIYGV